MSTEWIVDDELRSCAESIDAVASLALKAIGLISRADRQSDEVTYQRSDTMWEAGDVVARIMRLAATDLKDVAERLGRHVPEAES